MELTREEAIRNYREHWASLAVTGSEDKTEYLKRHGYSDIKANCFLCEFTCANCDKCPVEWPKTHESVLPVPCMNSYYGEWLYAATPGKRKRLAALIRDLPEKKAPEPEPKIKAGDRVIAISGSRKGMKGKVVEVLRDCVAILYSEKLLNRSHRFDEKFPDKAGYGWIEPFSWIDLLPQEPIFNNRTEVITFYITPDMEPVLVKTIYSDRTTICILEYDGKKFKGIAKCNPEDGYRERLGKIIAQDRASIELANYRIAHASS